MSTGRSYHFVDLVILVTCFLSPAIAFFLPWATILTTRFSAYDLYAGAFAGAQGGLYRSGMVLLVLIPACGLALLCIDVIRKKLTWHAYALLGAVGCITVAVYLEVSTGEVAVFVSAIGFLGALTYSVVRIIKRSNQGQ